MRWTGRTSLLASLLVSLALHALLATRMRQRASRPASAAQPAVELTIAPSTRSPNRPESSGATALESVAGDQPIARRDREGPPRKRASARPAVPATEAPARTADRAAPAPVPTAAPQGPREPQPAARGGALDLSPATAAATLAGELERVRRESVCEAPAGAGAADCDVPPPGARAAERLQEHMEHAASDVPHLSKRPPPRLRRDANGNHHYEGIGITALIRKDGSVDFTDRAAASVAPIPIGGTFDLTDAMDPNVYSAEKRRFLEGTEALRAQLAQEDRERVLSQGRLRLRGKLERVLADDGLSPLQKRVAAFDLWDDCAEDEVGREAQRVVEAFIRDRMPRASLLGYTDAELVELNLRRVSPRPFDPYAQPSGDPG